jgi:hypothetical protein
MSLLAVAGSDPSHRSACPFVTPQTPAATAGQSTVQGQTP